MGLLILIGLLFFLFCSKGLENEVLIMFEIVECEKEKFVDY